MSNIFQDIADDVDKVEQELLGPDYLYYKYISTPQEIGMSSEGSLDALTKDVGGLISYVELLVTGKGDGSTTGKPLGNRFFLKTGAKCRDIETNDDVTRYIYVNNVPTGRIPFISSGLGVNFSTFEGLIPAILEDLDDINPFDIFKGFLSGSMPDCQKLTMETTPSSTNNNQTKQTEFVTVSDIKSMEPCIFTLNDKRNPITKEKCREAFQNLEQYKKNNNPKGDPMFQLYTLIIALLGIYILYCFVRKQKM